MNLSQTELSYRRSAIEGASAIGLIVALFDTLVGDLRRAADALRKRDIEERCRQINHALLVLGQLESWVDLERGADAAQAIVLFYAQTRARMLDASVQQSAAILEKQIEVILKVRTAWHLLDTPLPASPVSPAVPPRPSSALPLPGALADRIPFSQSA